MGLKVKIEFCMQCNYASFAASFAEDAFEDLQTDIESLEMIPSSGGVFEISVNGEKIFSKWETDKFPDHKEVINKMETIRNFMEKND